MTDQPCPDPIRFIHALDWACVPEAVRARVKMCLLDLLGIAAGGLGTDLSRIIRDHAAQDMPGALPLVFDDRRSSAAGVALALGMSIDSLDGHDGYNLAKGHIGCPLLPGALVFGQQAGVSGRGFLEAMVMGYEFGARASVAQHATVADYHTSGSWGAVVVAAVGARLLGLDAAQTQHALGIAEYHGPRSQMMRCIDHPTMLKDGSGWGALAGVSAVQLAARGFTGAPAITVEQAPAHWQGLGTDWALLDQYFKPYPVCRWAQAPVEAVLALRRAHGLRAADVARLHVETFHESLRLATSAPDSTEAAQYSTSFPSAVALVHGDVRPGHLMGAALRDPEVLRLSRGMTMEENDQANAAFPARRLARVTLHLQSGGSVVSDWMEPKWDPAQPPSPALIRAKYDSLAEPVLGAARARAIADAVETLQDRPLRDLTDLLWGSAAG